MNDFDVAIGEVDNAINIMREVAQWCEDTGKHMWKLDVLTKDKLMKGLKVDNFYVGKVGTDNAASMILQWHDPLFWPQIKERESGFIHKLCVRRAYAGMGLSRKMIEYAIGECRKRGISYLRLDTGWNRSKLCDLYENIGFVKVDRRRIETIDYALYELRI